MFNAIKYTEELKKVGFSPDQADTSMKVLIDVMNENFATKSDFTELNTKIDVAKNELHAKIDAVKNELHAKIDAVKNELNAKIDAVKNELSAKFDAKIEALEYKLTIKLGTIVTIAIGVTATLLKLIESSH